jgi:Ca2+-binding EF-hand superfamily protein
MTTDLLTRKHAKSFGHFDRDHDQLITVNDLVDLGVRLLSGFSDNPASPTGKALVGSLQDLWEALLAHSNVDPLGRLTPQEHHRGMMGAFVEAEGGYDRAFAPAVDAVLKLADKEMNGLISLAEFTTLQNAFGTAADQIEPAFRALDQAGTGSLPAADLSVAVRQFYTGGEENLPGNKLFGQI